MSTIPVSTMALLRRQHGVATRRQLLDRGLTKSSIETLRRSGALVDVLRGVHHVPITELTEQARSTALCLARPDLAVSGPTAGRRITSRRELHLISPGNSVLSTCCR